MKGLYQKIRSLEGKNYGLYKSLAEKVWEFGDFSLEFLHIQGDPYAPASRIMVKANLQILGFASEWSSSFEKRLALSDFLLRKLCENVKEKFPEKNSAITLENPGPEILVRNTLWIDNGELRACLQIRLPGEGRKIQATAAAEILTMILPDLISSSLYNKDSKKASGACKELLEHYRVLAERSAILEELKKLDLVAFVPDGAILPRTSGLSEEPLVNAIAFKSPEKMSIALNICGREIRGMGIPKGITVITGGAFHGKSTLLQALTSAVYPHVPGDGREGIVIDETALRIDVEDGRYVRDTDVSPLVRDLPNGISTKLFNTSNASGSTSEAANLIEGIEFGSKTFLIDEDSSAVNFLIRDSRVRKLLGDKNEPLIPLTDRICDFSKAGFSFIIVAGACGEFLKLADNVIVMANYKAEDASAKVREMFEVSTSEKEELFLCELKQCRKFAEYIQPLLLKLRPTSAVERQVKVKLNGESLLQIGFLSSNTEKAGALLNKTGRLGAGYILLNLCQNVASNNETTKKDMQSQTINEMITELCEKIKNIGFRNLPQGMSRDLSLPRPIEIAIVLFRLH